MMSESFNAFRRLMSLSDLREEEVRFMFQSLANRDKSNLIAALGVRNRYHDAMEQAKGIVTRLP